MKRATIGKSGPGRQPPWASPPRCRAERGLPEAFVGNDDGFDGAEAGPGVGRESLSNAVDADHALDLSAGRA